MRQTRKTDYNAYIDSPQWRIFSNRIKIERGNKCEICHQPRSVEVLHCHHMTYKGFGQEVPSHVIVLCETCHNAYHAKYKGSGLPKTSVKNLRNNVVNTLKKFWKGSESPRGERRNVALRNFKTIYLTPTKKYRAKLAEAKSKTRSAPT